MAEFVIVGGGLAGLSAAVNLTKHGHKIDLIEASPKLGGRAYSFFDQETQTELDNGQHILIGAYTFTLDFLKTINSFHLLEVQSDLRIPFYKEGEKKFELNASKYFYPFNLLNAVWNYDVLSKIEKFKFIKFVISLLFTNENKINKLTILEWLKQNNQSDNAIKSFWEILAVGALNTNINEASALLFKRMLIKIFFYGNKASAIILPNSGLSNVFVNPAIDYLKNYKVSFSVSEKVEEIKFEKDRLVELKTNKRILTDFDYMIFATQPNQIEKIKSNKKILDENIIQYENSSIISVNIWLKQNNITEKFAALINSPIHWIFNHGKYITLVISSANKIINLSQDEIIEICYSELKKYFPNFSKNNVLSYKIIKEKRATIKSTPNFENFRENIETKFQNVCLIGDWTNTKLPQTIESAVKSGYDISKKFTKNL